MGQQPLPNNVIKFPRTQQLTIVIQEFRQILEGLFEANKNPGIVTNILTSMLALLEKIQVESTDKEIKDELWAMIEPLLLLQETLGTQPFNNPPNFVTLHDICNRLLELEERERRIADECAQLKDEVYNLQKEKESLIRAIQELQQKLDHRTEQYEKIQTIKVSDINQAAKRVEKTVRDYLGSHDQVLTHLQQLDVIIDVLRNVQCNVMGDLDVATSIVKQFAVEWDSIITPADQKTVQQKSGFASDLERIKQQVDRRKDWLKRWNEVYHETEERQKRLEYITKRWSGLKISPTRKKWLEETLEQHQAFFNDLVAQESRVKSELVQLNRIKDVLEQITKVHTEVESLPQIASFEPQRFEVLEPRKRTKIAYQWTFTDADQLTIKERYLELSRQYKLSIFEIFLCTSYELIPKEARRKDTSPKSLQVIISAAEKANMLPGSASEIISEWEGSKDEVNRRHYEASTYLIKTGQQFMSAGRKHMSMRRTEVPLPWDVGQLVTHNQYGAFSENLIERFNNKE